TAVGKKYSCPQCVTLSNNVPINSPSKISFQLTVTLCVLYPAMMFPKFVFSLGSLNTLNSIRSGTNPSKSAVNEVSLLGQKTVSPSSLVIVGFMFGIATFRLNQPDSHCNPSVLTRFTFT